MCKARIFRKRHHRLCQSSGIPCPNQLAELADRPRLGNSVQFGSQNWSTTSVGFENNRGKSLRGNLGVHEAVDGVVKRYRVGLLADESGAVLQTEVVNIVAEESLHRARPCQKKAGVGETTNHHLGRFEKNPLPFSNGEIESAHHPKDELVLIQAEPMPGGGGEGGVHRPKQGRVDSGMDDVELLGSNRAGWAMMSLCDGRGRVVVPLEENLRDKGGDGDNSVGLRKEMFAADRGARTFGEVSREDDKGTGLDQAGSEKSRPVVVAMMGVENPGFCAPQNPREGENLVRAKTGKRVKAKLLSRGGERSIDRSRHFDRPAQMGEAPGKSEALCIGPASLKSRVELKDPGGEGRRRHYVDPRVAKWGMTSGDRKQGDRIRGCNFRSEH